MPSARVFNDGGGLGAGFGGDRGVPGRPGERSIGAPVPTVRRSDGGGLVLDVPKAFHDAQPAETRPKLRLYKGVWFWVFWIAVIPATVISWGIVPLVLGVEGPSTVKFFAFLLALLEIAVATALVYTLRIARGTPLRLVAMSTLWGSTVALLMITPAAGNVAEKLGWSALIASFGGAYPEEIAKGLGIWMVLWIGRTWWNRPWHGIVAGLLVGLGFDAYENMMYSITLAPMHPASDMTGMLTIFGARTLVGLLAHMIFSGLVGYGIGQAMFAGRSVTGAARTRGWRFGQLLIWGFAGFAAHFLFNLMFLEAPAVVMFTIRVGAWSAGALLLVVVIWTQYRAMAPGWRAGLYPSVTLYLPAPAHGPVLAAPVSPAAPVPSAPTPPQLRSSATPDVSARPGTSMQRLDNPRHHVRMPTRSD